MRSDSELVLAAGAGDAAAFGEIVGRYQSLVCAIAYSGTGDVALSEEVAQDTFVAAWKGLGGLREPARLRSWLAGIARNLVKGARRTRARRRTEPLDLQAEGLEAPSPSPLERVLDAEQQSLVWRALAEIPETYREPLVLYYREEQSLERVAASLEISLDAAKQRLSRGRAQLREQVAALVEQTLGVTRPGKAFTLAVLAVLPAATPPFAAAAVAASAAPGGAAHGGAAAAGMAGAIAGPLLGLAGAYLGGRMSIENTRSPRERRYMVRVTWIAAGLALAFAAVELLGLLLLPRVFATLAGQVVVAVLYAGLLVAFILRTNRRQREIQVEDGTYVDPRSLPTPPPAPAAPRAILASLAGAVLGPLCWIPIMAFVVGDARVGFATIAFAAGVYALAAWAALRTPRAYFKLALATTVAVGVWTAVIVNLRWEPWLAVYRTTSIYDPASDLPLWAMNLMLATLYLAIGWRLLWLDRRQRLTS